MKLGLAPPTQLPAINRYAAESSLAAIPILIVIGDHAQDRVDASRKFQKEMVLMGGA